MTESNRKESPKGVNPIDPIKSTSLKGFLSCKYRIFILCIALAIRVTLYALEINQKLTGVSKNEN